MITGAPKVTTVVLTGRAMQHIYVSHLLDDVRDPGLVVELPRGWVRRASIVSGLSESVTTIANTMIELCEHLYEMHHEMCAHLLGIPGT
jgi:hypothetical protein